MKKLNIDIFIKILILLRFSAFYFKIIINNEIIRYVNPKIIPFAILGMIAMFIIVLFLVKELFNNKKKKVKFKNYVIFIIPLIMIFFMESNSASSTTIKSSDANASSNITLNDNLKNNTNQDNNLKNSSTFDLYEGKTESDGKGASDKKQLDIKENVINVNSKNFVFSLDEILSNPDKYVGTDIEITGFVYKDENIKENEFVIGRFMMACCAADMQIAGIRCEHSNLESYSNDTWIKVKGKIKKDTYNSTVDPIIVVDHMEKDLNPDTSYVYPF
ncbi:putative two-component membrane permease complex subunit [Clostridium puniceum]|uniref:Putative two-component membrane permease complex subunit n=1 Tax=Clostridium puniceum TaxID=29367 RepID=A0A1S8TPL9_9CLOT|nr:TIGR03943 family protein [Clostridium puniceum]OOM79666.1 putative two-component membrane permease complex subunit [Clostridium puniceum]